MDWPLFYRGNLLHGLPFAANSFQYTHQRLFVAAIPLDAWSQAIEELKRVTSPQGWIELIEIGNTFHNAGPATKQFLTWWGAISATKGIDASKMSQIGAFLKMAKLSNIQTETKILPVGNWGRRGGNLLAQDMLAGWPMMRPLAHSLLGILPDVFDEVIGRLETERNLSMDDSLFESFSFPFTLKPLLFAGKALEYHGLEEITW